MLALHCVATAVAYFIGSPFTSNRDQDFLGILVARKRACVRLD